MNVKIKTFVIPAFDNEQSEEQLNAFLASHRVLQTERHFCLEKNGYWAFLVEYMDGDPYLAKPAYRNEKKDVTADLDEQSLARFNVYKEKRLEISKEKAMPAYAVFKDKELVELSKLPTLNEQTVKDLKGVSPQRLKEYVSYFFNLTDGKASGQSYAQNSGDGQPV